MNDNFDTARLNIMTESEFLQYGEALLARLEEEIEETGCDLECETSGHILTIDGPNGQVVVNCHVPNRELWIAAKSGGFHFSRQNGQWLSQRDGSGFDDVLNRVLSEACGEAVVLPGSDA